MYVTLRRRSSVIEYAKLQHVLVRLLARLGGAGQAGFLLLQQTLLFDAQGMSTEDLQGGEPSLASEGSNAL